jgi:hypothetical protein
MSRSLFADWVAWWDTVPPEFAFLFVLFFVVAAAGLIGHALRSQRSGRRSRPRPRNRPAHS